MNSQLLVELQEVMGNDESVCNSAWTSSYDKTKRDTKLNVETDVKRVVDMLADSGHGTPFESVVFRFWLRMPIFVDRQFMTYRIASHNGLSGRYRSMPTDYLEVPDDVMDIMEKVDSNVDNIYSNESWNLLGSYYESCEIATNNYKHGIEKAKNAEKAGFISNQEFKRFREIWRAQLPTAGFVERTTIINLRSLANMFKQRISNDAQKETRQIAELMLQCIKDKNVAPLAIQALERNNWII